MELSLKMHGKCMIFEKESKYHLKCIFKIHLCFEVIGQNFNTRSWTKNREKNCKIGMNYKLSIIYKLTTYLLSILELINKLFNINSNQSMHRINIVLLQLNQRLVLG